MNQDTELEDKISEYKESICPETYEFVSRCSCPDCSRFRRIKIQITKGEKNDKS